jgi:hypothetical protein
VLSIWVEELRISERVAEKLTEKHGISASQVRAAIVQVPGLDFAWDFDTERGFRAIVRASIEGDREDNEAVIVLYPTENPADQAWRLGSAYYILG